jgi:hypothetical protein
MIGENNMPGVFPKTPEQPIMAIVLTEEMVDQYDATLERQINTISQVNSGVERTDNSVMLQFHAVETRKLLAGLREHMALIEYYKKRIGN